MACLCLHDLLASYIWIANNNARAGGCRGIWTENSLVFHVWRMEFETKMETTTVCRGVHTNKTDSIDEFTPPE